MKPPIDVTLTSPIDRGETTVTTVTLREPAAGEMRGLKLMDIMQMDVGSLITLIPRISTPPLSPREVDALCPADIAVLGAATVSFFGGAVVPGALTALYQTT